MRWSSWLIAALMVVVCGALFGSLHAAAQARANAPLAAFTIMAPVDVSESQLVARALVPIDAPCPEVAAEGPGGKVRLEMSERRPGPRAEPAFSTILACSAALPMGLTKAQIGEYVIPAALPEVIDTVAIIADSGCRVDDKRIQDCNDPDAWPLAQMAQRIADAQPDVILDPGDYYYREIACPSEDASQCSPGPAPTPGMPFDENDQGWMYEAFEPMSAMFPVAPIAFLRGNHEDCGRAGNGYFLYLDPREGVEAICEPREADGELETAEPQITPTWAFDLPLATARTLRVAMVDSAYGTDKEITEWVAEQRVAYEQAADLTQTQSDRESWLLTHRPIFSLIADVNLPKDDPLADAWSSDGQMVASYGLLGTYSMVLSSHNHFAQAVQIPGQPGSLIMGNGGALLDPAERYESPEYGPLAKSDGTPLVTGLTPYPTASSLWTSVQYGYAIATPAPTAGDWRIEQFDFAGAPLATCQLVADSIACG